MKIAIFADSHGDTNLLPQYPHRDAFNNVGPGWPDLVSQQFEVTNFSKCGTGTYYSYKLFCEHHTKFDKIIFIPSQVGRFTISLPDTNDKFHCVPGFIKLLDDRINGDPEHKFRDRQVFSAARDYMIHVLDLEREKVFDQLMIAQIKRMRPDTIMIPAFDSSDIGPLTLGYISMKELEHWKITNQYLRNLPLTEVRKCHLSIENNYMVFEKIKNVLNGVSSKFELDKNDFKIPAHPWQHYFKKLGLPRNV